jgi:hypothetical protein
MNKNSTTDSIDFLECAACSTQFELDEPLDNETAELVQSTTLLCGDCHSTIVNIDSILYD